jgi:hypothetical protein
MAVSQNEIDLVKRVYHSLVTQDLIRIKKINEFGDCTPGYTREGKAQLEATLRALNSVNPSCANSVEKLPTILQKIDIQALLRAHPKYEEKMAEWATACQAHLQSDDLR